MPVAPTAAAAFSAADELAALLDVSPAAMGLLRPLGAPAGNPMAFTDLAFDYLNPAARQLTGLSARPTETWLTRLPATHWLLDICRAALESGETGHYELPPAGPAEPGYRLTFRPLSEGRLVMGCGVEEAGSADRLHLRLQQLTAESGVLRQQLARAETAALSHEQERENFYQVFEQTPAIVALLRGPRHHILYCNPAFQALYPARRLLGLPYAEAMPEVVAHGLIPELDEVYATGRIFYGSELPVVATPPDGAAPHQRYYDFSYQPYRENNVIVGISIFAYDVTGQVQARRQRENQQQQLTEVFEQAPVAICLFRGPGYVLEIVNALMLDILQRPLPQLLGRPFAEALPELAEQGLVEVLDEVRRSGQAYVVQERALQLAHHQADEMGYYNFVYEPLHDEQGQPTGIVCVATEVTEPVMARQLLSTANEQLLAANQQLTYTNADLDNFIYTASHDLKAPISNIEALVTALREDLALPPAAQTDVPGLLDLMQDSVERFKRTIDQLTDITKLQKAHAAQLAPLRLADLVEAVRRDLAPELAALDATLTVEVPADLMLHFAEKNLRSIIYNLLSNAFKYRHPARHPRVLLRATRTATEVVLEVHDNGLGLTLAQQPRVFDMFQRLHDHVEGSGLGLYMVKKILDNVGGRIELNSESGVGSVFRVQLPV